MRFIIAIAALSLAACVNSVDDGDFGQAMAGGEENDEQGLTSECAKGPTVKGIDVSYYQGNIDWHKVANDGVKYAFVRVSDGTGFVDPKFAANWSGAKSAGVMRGVYQFFEANESGTAQADLLLSKMGHLEKGDLPPVADIEDGSDDGQSAATIIARAKDWVKRIEEKTGVHPIIYTGPYHWVDSVADSSAFHTLPLWVAHYGTRCPYVPPAWSKWTFHQWTSTARVAGIGGSTDENDFNGTLDDLRALAFDPAPPGPKPCVTGRYDGAFCDDDGTRAEPLHDRLHDDLDVPFSCGKIDGSPAFCGDKIATRAEAVYVITKAARIPLGGHPDAFVDDEHNEYEQFLDAAHAYGILRGYEGRKAEPDVDVTRDMLARFLRRTYDLPAATKDYFVDDNGDPDEAVHNAVAAAGLFDGFPDGHGHRVFKGNDKADRTTLARVAVRAAEAHFSPVWK